MRATGEAAWTVSLVEHFHFAVAGMARSNSSPGARGDQSSPHPRSSRRSQARAIAHSRFTADGCRPSTAAVSSIDRPVK